MDIELLSELYRARLIVAGVAWRMLDGAHRRPGWSVGQRRIIRRRALHLLELAEANHA